MAEKDKTTTILLAFFLGWLGVHRFYLRQPGLGILYIGLSCLCVGWIAGLIDGISFLAMSDDEFNRKYNPHLAAAFAGTQGPYSNQQFSTNNPAANLNYGYNAQLIQMRTVETLENLYMIAKTKDMETLLETFGTTRTRYDDFTNHSKNSGYKTDVKAGMQTYRTKHPSRILSEAEQSLVLSPDSKALEAFYCTCIMNCFRPYYIDQIESIGAMPRGLSRNNLFDRLILEINKIMKEIKAYRYGNDLGNLDDHIRELENLLEKMKVLRQG